MIQTCLICKIPENLGTAILTGGGGPAVEMTDECEANGLQVPSLTKKAQKMINEFVPEVNSNLTNPLEFGANGSREVMIKVIEVVDTEPHISTIMTTIRPERYKAQGVDIAEVVKTYANAISPNSNKNLVNIHRSFGTPATTVESVLEYYTKARENGIMIYRSVAAAAKSIYRLWSYGDYLKNRGYRN